MTLCLWAQIVRQAQRVNAIYVISPVLLPSSLPLFTVTSGEGSAAGKQSCLHLLHSHNTVSDAVAKINATFLSTIWKNTLTALRSG